MTRLSVEESILLHASIEFEVGNRKTVGGVFNALFFDCLDHVKEFRTLALIGHKAHNHRVAFDKAFSAITAEIAAAFGFTVFAVAAWNWLGAVMCGFVGSTSSFLPVGSFVKLLAGGKTLLIIELDEALNVVQAVLGYLVLEDEEFVGELEDFFVVLVCGVGYGETPIQRRRILFSDARHFLI